MCDLKLDEIKYTVEIRELRDAGRPLDNIDQKRCRTYSPAPNAYDPRGRSTRKTTKMSRVIVKDDMDIAQRWFLWIRQVNICSVGGMEFQLAII